MIDDNVLRRIRGLVKTLNPGAKVLETSLRASKHSENPYGTKTLDVRDIIATGAYSEETSIKSSGWLRSIHEMTMVDNHGRMVMTPKPETLEYVFCLAVLGFSSRLTLLLQIRHQQLCVYRAQALSSRAPV